MTAGRRRLTATPTLPSPHRGGPGGDSLVATSHSPSIAVRVGKVSLLAIAVTAQNHIQPQRRSVAYQKANSSGVTTNGSA